MRVLVAGATGATGQPLVAALVARGHEVAGLTRDAGRASWLPAFATDGGGRPSPHVAAGPGADLDGRYYAEQLRGADNRRARDRLPPPAPAVGISAARGRGSPPVPVGGSIPA